ncbi:PI-PLC X domain-containing protein 2-like [Diachasmimorpha longicaudata]|uniref:PI-PLC X domain-containing protein 2-like n=1 Tax=Diachasmimorpha longicaudata TaxID=58733 RepID=UPI0030B8E8FA
MYRIVLSYIAHICLFKAVLSKDLDNIIIVFSSGAITATQVPNELRIYYHHPDFVKGDTLRVYDVEPKSWRQAKPRFVKKIKRVSAFVRTGLRAPPPFGMDKYYAMIIRNDTSLKRYSDPGRFHWMEDRKALIQNLSLPNLFIPGTHDSGSYQRPGKDGIIKNLTANWAICQDASIFEQLESGVRFLDIRPACRKVRGSCKTYYVNHGPVQMVPMSQVIHDVDLFLNITKEIVILSVKQFPSGFDNEKDHRRFMKYLKDELSRHIFKHSSAETGWKTPLSNYWSENKRLIISYTDKNYLDSETFWPGIEQRWCNCRDFSTLHDFLESPAKWNSTVVPVADMAELTHNVGSVVTDLTPLTDNSIRAWADEAGEFIPEWYHEEFNASANIVAVDFLHASGIVDLAIWWNEKRALRSGR